MIMFVCLPYNRCCDAVVCDLRGVTEGIWGLSLYWWYDIPFNRDNVFNRGIIIALAGLWLFKDGSIYLPYILFVLFALF
jgi:hypothetical protein